MTLESQTSRTCTESMRVGLRTTLQFQLVRNLSYLSCLKLYREWRHLPTQCSRKLHYRTRHLNFSFLGMCKFVFSLSTFKPAVTATNIRTGTVTYISHQYHLLLKCYHFFCLLEFYLLSCLRYFLQSLRSNTWNNRHSQFSLLIQSQNSTSAEHIICETLFPLFFNLTEWKDYNLNYKIITSNLQFTHCLSLLTTDGVQPIFLPKVLVQLTTSIL